MPGFRFALFLVCLLRAFSALTELVNPIRFMRAVRDWTDGMTRTAARSLGAARSAGNVLNAFGLASPKPLMSFPASLYELDGS